MRARRARLFVGSASLFCLLWLFCLSFLSCHRLIGIDDVSLRPAYDGSSDAGTVDDRNAEGAVGDAPYSTNCRPPVGPTRCRDNSSDCTRIVLFATGTSGYEILSVAVDDTRVYWTSKKTGATSRIVRTAKTGGPEEVVRESAGTVFSRVIADGTYVYFLGGDDFAGSVYALRKELLPCPACSPEVAYDGGDIGDVVATGDGQVFGAGLAVVFLRRNAVGAWTSASLDVGGNGPSVAWDGEFAYWTDENKGAGTIHRYAPSTGAIDLFAAVSAALKAPRLAADCHDVWGVRESDRTTRYDRATGRLVDSAPYAPYVNRVVVDGSFVYAASPLLGVLRIDKARLSDLQTLYSGNAVDVAVDDTTVYVADRDRGIFAIPK